MRRQDRQFYLIGHMPPVNGYKTFFEKALHMKEKQLVAALPSLSKASVRLGMENGPFSGSVAETLKGRCGNTNACF